MTTQKTGLRRLTVAALAAAGLAAGAGAGSALATTGPVQYAVVKVVIKDGRIALNKKGVADVTFVDFLVHNRGKQPHDFSIGGVKTAQLKPGQTAHLFVGFPIYGDYTYVSGKNAPKMMRGKFHVERPLPPG